MKAENLGDMKASSALYYAAFICFCAAEAIGIDHFAATYSDVQETITILLRIASLLFLAIKYALQRYSPRSLAILLVATLLAAYCSLRAGRLDLLWTVLFIGASQGIEVKKLALISLIISICSVLLTISMWEIGILENIQIVKSGGVIQNSFGYSHPNQFGKVLMSIVMSLIVLSWGKMHILRFALIIGIVASIQFVTGSRTSAILSVIALLIGLVAQHSLVNKMRWLTCALAVSSIGLSFYFMYFYGTQPWHYFLDELFSNRLYWMHYYISNYSLSLFGQGVDGFETLNFSTVDSSFLVDNSFAFILIRYGVIVFVAIVALLILLVKKGYVYSEPVTLTMLGLSFLVGFSESYFFQFDFNYFLIAFGGLLYGSTNVGLFSSDTRQNHGSAHVASLPLSELHS